MKGKRKVPVKTRQKRALAVSAKNHKQKVQEKAIASFRQLGVVRYACEDAGIDRGTWYNWIEQDPEFAAAVKKAKEDAIDVLERAAIERGRTVSDTLAIFLLKSQRREVYGERQQLEHTGPGGGPLQTQQVPNLTEEQGLALHGMGPTTRPAK